MKNIMELLNNPYIKYPLIVISAIAIIKTGYDLGSFIKKVNLFLNFKNKLTFLIIDPLL